MEVITEHYAMVDVNVTRDLSRKEIVRIDLTKKQWVEWLSIEREINLAIPMHDSAQRRAAYNHRLAFERRLVKEYLRGK